MTLGVVGFEAQGQYNPWTETGAPVGREIGSGRMIYVPQGGYPIGLFLPVPGGYVPRWALANGRYSRSVVLAQVPTYQPVQLSDGRTVWEGDENGTTRYYSHDPSAEAQATLIEARAEQVRADADAQYAENERYRARTTRKSDRWTDQRLQSGSHQRANNEAGRQIEEGRPSAVAARHLGYRSSQTEFQPTALDPDTQRAQRQVTPASPAANRATSSVPARQTAVLDTGHAATTPANPYPGMVRGQISRLADAVAVGDAVEAEASRQKIIRLGISGYAYVAGSPDQVNPQSWISAVQTALNQEGLAIHEGRNWFLEGVNEELAGRP